ncbi:MAG: GNAT family N-acetyltransferase [Caulobacteraceae bacterium]|nr:GNAT family N-acetyltransferase [Caulobacteraceae bacterium]
MTIAVRPATPDDAPLVLAFIRELAEYEHLADRVKITLADVRAILFDPAPRAFCDVALAGDEAVGFALWFYSVSTFEGRHGIYLEDLYVRPHARGKGAGLALLKELASRCRRERLGRLEWSVLDWNEPAIRFYDRIGADVRDGWTVRRLSGSALADLAP